MFYNAEEKILELPDKKFRYITFGKGKKVLIMIQGLNTNGIKGAALSLAYMYRIFAKEYTVYLFDRREELYENITVEDMANDVIEAMEYLNIKKADILGVSQGGMIAQYIAIHRSDLVNKLVLALTLCRNNSTVEKVIHNWITLTKEDKYKELVYDMAYKMYSKNYIQRYKLFMPLLTLIQKPKDKNRFITLTKSCLTCDTYELLEKIKCKVLVIGAKEDQIVEGRASIELAEKLNCELYMYENLGHAAYEEAKDFNTKVYEFFVK